MNQIVWLDLGVSDLDRAIAFYKKVLQNDISIETFESFRFGVFSHSETGVSGCLVPQKDFVPQPASTLIYFNVDGRLDDAVAQVETHGGKIIQPPHAIGPHGSRAIVLDSEGNTIALHSTATISE